MVHIDVRSGEKEAEEEECRPLERTRSQLRKQIEIQGVLRRLHERRGPICELSRTVSELAGGLGGETAERSEADSLRKAVLLVEKARKRARNFSEDLMEDMLALDKLTGLAVEDRVSRKAAVANIEALLEDVDAAKRRLGGLQKDLQANLTKRLHQLQRGADEAALDLEGARQEGGQQDAEVEVSDEQEEPPQGDAQEPTGSPSSSSPSQTQGDGKDEQPPSAGPQQPPAAAAQPRQEPRRIQVQRRPSRGPAAASEEQHPRSADERPVGGDGQAASPRAATEQPAAPRTPPEVLAAAASEAEAPSPLQLRIYPPSRDLWKEIPLALRFQTQERPTSYEIFAAIPGLSTSDINLEVSEDHSTLKVGGLRAPTEHEAAQMMHQLAAAVQRAAGAPARFRQLAARFGEVSKAAYVEMGHGEFGLFEETFQLPRDVLVDEIKASYRNGVLRITIPRIQRRVLARHSEGPRSAVGLRGLPLFSAFPDLLW